jgi:beta-lactamase class D
MKQQAKVRKEKQANCFKQLERAYEKAFFKAENARKGELTMLDKMEDQFWVAVEAKNLNIKLPDSDFKRRSAVPLTGDKMERSVLA